MAPTSNTSPTNRAPTPEGDAASCAFAMEARWHDVVDSTMPLAREAALDGAPSGTAIVARAQRSGRGRGAALWASPAGTGLYASVVLWPCANWPVASLSPALGLGVLLGCRAAGADGLCLKWPNDLLNPAGKVAGLLLESGQDRAHRRYVVLGVGLNLRAPVQAVAAKPGTWALPPAGLFADDAQTSAEALWAAVHAQVGIAFVAWQAHGFGPSVAAYNAAHGLWQQSVLAVGAGPGGETCSGRVGSIEADGSLALHCADGRRALYVGSLRPAGQFPV